MTAFHWSEGNGALPFPGHRVESSSPGPYANMIRYEIREYLGNETIVSYVLMIPKDVPASWAWREMEERFNEYLWA
jgi:hypothetical protein